MRAETQQRGAAGGSRFQDGSAFHLHAELDGRGHDDGALIAAGSAETLSRITALCRQWLRLTTTPIVPIEESCVIAGEAVAFRDSVSYAPCREEAEPCSQRAGGGRRNSHSEMA